MNKDSEIIKELEYEIGESFQRFDSDQILRTLDFGCAVDESGYVVGVNFSEIGKLKRIPEMLIKFHHLKKLSFYRVGICDFSILAERKGTGKFPSFGQSRPIDRRRDRILF